MIQSKSSQPSAAPMGVRTLQEAPKAASFCSLFEQPGIEDFGGVADNTF